MAIELRDYQKRAISELTTRFSEHRRVVAVAPTGSGKTVIGAAFITRSKYKRVLWLAHRIELLRQARDQLTDAGIAGVGLWSGVEKDVPNVLGGGPRVLVASVSMFRGGKLPDDFDLVVIDECHHATAASYARILDGLPDGTKVLGLTATPWRLDGQPLGDAFDDLVVMGEAVELAAEGHIINPVIYGLTRAQSEALVKGVTFSGADYSPRLLDQAMRKQPLMADIVKEWKRLAQGRPTIVYACSVEHSIEIRDRFRAAGVTAEHVDWSTPDAERVAILGYGGEGGRLASGETRVVCNVGILTEGVDCPPVKCIVLARPTRSLALFRQMCGRASRPSGDKRSLIIDHAGNTWRLGFPDSPIEWSLSGKIKLGGEQPVKRCRECGAMNPIAARDCVECGVEFELTERELVEREAELERIRQGDAVRRRTEEILRALAKRKTPPKGEAWVQQALQEVCG
jgi:DNA repair protein RadD